MGNYANFYGSKDGDRLYGPEAFEEWLRPFFKTGVFNNELQVLSNNDMSIKVSPGNVYVNGKMKFFENYQTLTVEPPHASLKRIDNVIMRRNDPDRDFEILIQKGLFSETPTAPTPVRHAGIYDLVIAQVYVGASVVKILQENITDTRMNSTLCGWVVSGVEDVDFEQITLQWLSYIANFKQLNEDEFNAWFLTIKDKLSSDVAGSLQNQIDSANSRIDKRLVEQEFLVKFLSTGWVASSSGKKFTQRVNVQNMKEIYKPYPSLINSTVEATELLEVENMYIKIIDTYDGYVVATCHNDKPAVDLNILLTVYKEQDNG